MFHVRFQQSFILNNAFSVLTFKVLGGTQWYFICSTTALFCFLFLLKLSGKSHESRVVQSVQYSLSSMYPIYKPTFNHDNPRT